MLGLLDKGVKGCIISNVRQTQQESMKGVENVFNVIKKQRENKGVSQETLAMQAKISRPHLSDIENGKAQPSVEVAFRIAAALGCSIEALFFTRNVSQTQQNTG